MAQTTTAQTACDVAISLDNSGGTLTDISGSTNQVTMDWDVLVGETGTFGSKWPIRTTCGLDCPVSVVIVFTTTADEGYDILNEWFWTSYGAARTLQIDLPNGTAGSDRYSGEYVLDSANIPTTARVGDAIMVTFNALPNGTVTQSAIAS